MSLENDPNASEIAYWNGPAGLRWLRRQQQQDALLAPVSDLLLPRAAPRSGQIVVDVGCGCGATTLELARRVAPDGSVLGVDVSAPMLERARALAGRPDAAGLRLRFALADATCYAFEPARADLLFSRFGVMFFSDPARSFENLRRALRPRARLVFSCWRAARQNPWLMLPLQEVTRHVPRLPELGPEAPGPFSLAEEARVRGILQRAGFVDVGMEPVDLLLDLAHGGGLEAALETALQMGPASRALEGQPPHLQAAAAESVRAALARCQQGERVPLPGALWIVTAAGS